MVPGVESFTTKSPLKGDRSDQLIGRFKPRRAKSASDLESVPSSRSLISPNSSKQIDDCDVLFVTILEVLLTLPISL